MGMTADWERYTLTSRPADTADAHHVPWIVPVGSGSRAKMDKFKCFGTGMVLFKNNCCMWYPQAKPVYPPPTMATLKEDRSSIAIEEKAWLQSFIRLLRWTRGEQRWRGNDVTNENRRTITPATGNQLLSKERFFWEVLIPCQWYLIVGQRNMCQSGEIERWNGVGFWLVSCCSPYSFTGWKKKKKKAHPNLLVLFHLFS